MTKAEFWGCRAWKSRKLGSVSSVYCESSSGISSFVQFIVFVGPRESSSALDSRSPRDTLSDNITVSVSSYGLFWKVKVLPLLGRAPHALALFWFQSQLRRSQLQNSFIDKCLVTFHQHWIWFYVFLVLPLFRSKNATAARSSTHPR